MTNARLPDALRLSGHNSRATRRPDKAFTPHPAVVPMPDALRLSGLQILAPLVGR